MLLPWGNSDPSSFFYIVMASLILRNLSPVLAVLLVCSQQQHPTEND